MNRIVNSKTLLICVIGFLSLYIAPALASEVTGSLCTGVNCPVEGTVIAAPTASPAAGSFTSNQSVTLTSTGATSIRYTTDGTTPTCASTQYSSAISVTSSKTIKAISCYANSTSSTVASFAYTISIPSSGGGGGGGGSFTVVASPTPTPTPTPSPTVSPSPTPSVSSKPLSQMTITELQAEIARLMALILQLQTQQSGVTQPITVPNLCSGISFSRNLELGMSGNDIKCLQSFLNQSADTMVTASGIGSPGRETTYFWSLTKAAVIKFQDKYASEVLIPLGLSKGTGFVGPSTRAKLNELIQ